MKSRFFKLLFLALGIALFAYVLQQSDITLILEKSIEIGLLGILLILTIYFAAFLVDTASWQLSITDINLDFRHLYTLWKIRMIGEAVNAATPFGTMGGEPIKAAMLKHSLGIDYNQGIASLILARTVNLIGLNVFLFVGFIMIALSDAFPDGFKLATGGALGAFAVAIGGFFLVQKYEATSRFGARLARFRFGRPLLKPLDYLRTIESHLVLFYSGDDRRFSRATGLAMLNWMIGTIEVYAILMLLGAPVTIWEAWILESAVQLTRTATFFIPLSLGTQEAALFVISSAITGNGSVGLAISIIKRLRELVWIAWGFAIGWRTPLRSTVETVPSGSRRS
jgi:uncharacterized protein (TIRG00374 family)